MKTLLILSALAICLLPVQPAHAGKIYTCTANGRVTYTTKPSGNCHGADLPPIGRYSSLRYDAPQARSEPAAPAPAKNRTAKAAAPRNVQTAAAPVVPAAPKAAGSSGRRAILQQELANERQALSSDQQALTSARTAQGGSVNQQLVHRLQGSVLDRQQNIQALQRELARM